MKTKYRILALTDSSGHSKENSLYALLSEMKAHERCEHIHVACRGFSENHGFFKDPKSGELQAINIDGNFTFDVTGKQFNNATFKVDLHDHDIVLMRLPRPISDEFLVELSNALKGIVVVNEPHGILKTSSKEFLLNFPHLCPPMKLCFSLEDILEFSSKYETILKPLKEYGGKGILRIKDNLIDDGEEQSDLIPYLAKLEKEIGNGYVAMRFLKNVTKGDKRSLVVSGEILASSLRMPPDGSWLCNVSRGGYSIKAEATEDERKIVQEINPILCKLGVLIYGMDTLEDDDGKRVLSEINTMSIGGFPQAQEQSGKPIIKQTIEKIFDHADAKYIE